MKKGQIWRLEKRRRRYPLEVLDTLRSEAPGTRPEHQAALLGLLGSVLGELGHVLPAARILRRACDLVNLGGTAAAGRELLKRHDELAKRALYPRREADVDGVIADVLSTVDLPTVPAKDRAWLKQMDELRYERPQAALLWLLPETDRVPAELKPLYLGVTGSTYRLRAGQREEIEADLRRGEGMIRAGLWIVSGPAPDPGAEADLLQRLAYIEADRGDYRQSLGLAERAGGIYDRIGARTGRGKALVDAGVFLNGLGRHHEGIRAQSRALQLLPESESFNRFAALQGLGHLYRTAGDLDSAIAYLNRAAEIDGMPAAFAARLVWLRGSVLADLGDEPQAAEALGAAVELLRSVHYADTALATVELMRVLILLGREEEAHRTGLTVRQLIFPLRRNRHVSAALAELLRGGRAALTLGHVDRVRQALDQARRRRSWRLFKVRSA